VSSALVGTDIGPVGGAGDLGRGTRRHRIGVILLCSVLCAT
jgi:hypothetical protein